MRKKSNKIKVNFTINKDKLGDYFLVGMLSIILIVITIYLNGFIIVALPYLRSVAGLIEQLTLPHLFYAKVLFLLFVWFVFRAFLWLWKLIFNEISRIIKRVREK